MLNTKLSKEEREIFVSFFDAVCNWAEEAVRKPQLTDRELVLIRSTEEITAIAMSKETE